MSDEKHLEQLLISQSKHGNYQMLPTVLINKIPELGKYSQSRRFDDRRYQWFSEKLNFTNKSVLDIGANIGYFSFRLAIEKNAKVTAYEPYLKHFDAIKSIKTILELYDDQITPINKGVELNDIENLPEQDIVLFFNVIQHAGEDFDCKYVHNKTEWEKYAIEYLHRLTYKAKYIVFQQGYTWLGHAGKLCQDENIIDFTATILRKANWNIKCCGIIKDVSNPTYSDFEVALQNNIHPITNKWQRIKLNILRKIRISNNDYRFMQRPIFICTSRSSG